MRVAALLLAALAAACARPLPAPAPRDPASRLVVLPAGSPRAPGAVPTVYAEVAADEAARTRGLGGRERLAEDAGMLFAYPDDQARHFWMKDCYVALDIAFVDSGRRIVRIVTLPPGAGRPDEAVPRCESFVPVRYVLETSSGWFARHNVGVGDTVDLSAALAGVEPR